MIDEQIGERAATKRSVGEPGQENNTASVRQRESDLHFSIRCSKHMKTEKYREKKLGKKWTHSCLRSVK